MSKISTEKNTETLSEIVWVYWGITSAPTIVHKDNLEEVIKKIAFCEYGAYQSRLENQQKCNPNFPQDSYAFEENYLFNVMNITVSDTP